MANEVVVAHMRRGQRLSLISALFATSVPILEFIATGNAWPFRLTAVSAVFAWINFIVQTRVLRSVSDVQAG
jgi:hypothetical protein